jgi:hypothetical protein
MRWTATLGLALVSACSFAYSRPPITPSTHDRSCAKNHARVDVIAGASLVGGGVVLGAIALSDQYQTDVTMLLGGLAAAGVGAVFLASSADGFADIDKCEQELLAVQPTQPEPHAPAVVHAAPPIMVRTCDQRRHDMYTRAVTGADQAQRVRLLKELPSCSERAERERAWGLTRMASLDAAAGNCESTQTLVREVYELDVVLHDVVLMSDIEVKHCLTR